jgi:hypothetical protein
MLDQDRADLRFEEVHAVSRTGRLSGTDLQNYCEEKTRDGHRGQDRADHASRRWTVLGPGNPR